MGRSLPLPAGRVPPSDRDNHFTWLACLTSYGLEEGFSESTYRTIFSWNSFVSIGVTFLIPMVIKKRYIIVYYSIYISQKENDNIGTTNLKKFHYQ